MPMLLLLSLVLATSVEGWSHNGALGDSTPFQLFADTSYASLSSFADHGTQNVEACMKICEDDPNCASFVITGSGVCWANTDDQFTVRRVAGASLYKKAYRVRTLITPITDSLKLRSAHDGLCLENPRNTDNRVTTYECDTDPNRGWKLPRLTSYINMRYRLFHIQSDADNQCLEATSSSDHTLVELQACDTSTSHANKNQRWQLLETLQFRNEREGRCLELDDQKVITLQPCANASSTQHWLTTTNHPGRLEFDATRIDEVNVGDQRFLFNPHLNLDHKELACNDCPQHA